MDSSVRSRPSHYEILGVRSAANDEEIAQAFGRKMSAFRFHPTGTTAGICAAYETLRNPAKRRAYDCSIGIIPKAAPRHWGFAMTQRWAPFIAAPFTSADGQRSSVEAPTEPHVTVVPEAPSEPKLSSFIAASLRELARPVARDHLSEPARQPKDDERVDAALERHIEEVLTARLAEEESWRDAEVRANWKRPGLAVGGFFLAAGLIGTLAGMSVRDDAGSAQADPAATIGRAPAKQQTDVAASSSTHFVPAVETPAGAGSHARTRHSASRHRPSAWAKQEIASVEAGGTPAGQGQATQLAGDQLAADPLAPENLLKSSGRGIFLIRNFMDEVDLQRAPQGGMEVRMVKRGHAAGATDSSVSA